MGATVYYLAGDYDLPSWGVGLLYSHVELLRKHDVEARVLHQQAPFRISWLDTEVPVAHLDDPRLDIRKQDIVVVPEVLAEQGRELGPCRRVVFVQGTFLTFTPFAEAVSYRDLGYEAAFAVLPHTKAIVERHFDIEAQVVPPFIASYFFADPQQLASTTREKRILVFPKTGYREAGYHDLEIATKLLKRRCEEDPGWEFVEVSGRSHREVAALMKESAFLVNLNCLEAFNTTVPEAMAAGCIAICYEAYGGQDFLADRHNAYVFPNNYLFPLVEALFELMDDYEIRQDELAALRRNAHRTACGFRKEATEQALLEAFRALGPGGAA